MSDFPLVAVGIGNTTVQLGLFTQQADRELPIPSMQSTLSTDSSDWNPLLESLANDLDSPTKWYVASVVREATSSIERWARSQTLVKDLTILKNDAFPIALAVDSPTQMGTDRVAAAVAVNALRDSSRSAIFVDAGTAITVNAIDRKGTLVGGAILPGVTTAGRALDHSTDALPNVQVRADLPAPQAIGRDTLPAIASGIYWGSIGAARECIQRISAELPDESPQLFITGGFGPAIADHLDQEIVLVPHLVLSGIALAVQNR